MARMNLLVTPRYLAKSIEQSLRILRHLEHYSLPSFFIPPNQIWVTRNLNERNAVSCLVHETEHYVISRLEGLLAGRFLDRFITSDRHRAWAKYQLLSNNRVYLEGPDSRFYGLKWTKPPR